MVDQIWLWVGFNVFVLAMLAVDLFVFHKEAHEVSSGEAAAWTVVWVALALVFGSGVYAFMGREAGLEYFAGYLIEKALSVDNVFVFVLIFGFFRVPLRYQHRVLFWGILGALVMRGVMIVAGAYLIQQFHWVMYVFARSWSLPGSAWQHRSSTISIWNRTWRFASYVGCCL
jgi:tellurite resistance protein TerC